MRASFVGVFAVIVGASDPFKPNWLHIPTARMECNDNQYLCDMSGEQCRHFPNRFCVYQCAAPEAGNETCFEGCEGDSPGVCMHKSLFPMLPNDLSLLVILFLVAIAAGAAGIGGGGLNVPLLLLIANFGIKESTPLSHSAVFGNSIAQIVMNCPQPHPKCKVRPLIHYELAFLLLPAMLGGNSLGVVLGRIMPATLMVILAVLLLLLALTKTFKKGLKTYHECTKIEEDAVLRGQSSIEMPVQQPGGPPVLGSSGLDALAQSFTGSVREDERMRIPWKVIGMMIAFNVFVLFDQLLQSDDIFKYEVFKKCHAMYWISLFGLYPFVFIALKFGINSLQELARFHANRGDGKIEGDPDVTVKSAIFYAGMTACVGLLAGILGLGGGEFMVPLLLEFGLSARVAAATSGFLIVFSTSNNIAHYLIAGTLGPMFAYAFSCAIVACLGAFVGLVVRDTAYVRANSYIVVFALCGLLFVSMCLLMVHGFWLAEVNFEFGSFCGDSDGDR